MLISVPFAVDAKSLQRESDAAELTTRREAACMGGEQAMPAREGT
jgi:hypothetical protein